MCSLYSFSFFNILLSILFYQNIYKYIYSEVLFSFSLRYFHYYYVCTNTIFSQQILCCLYYFHNTYCGGCDGVGSYDGGSCDCCLL